MFLPIIYVELHRHIANTDAPAGDITGAREIGYLFGQYTDLEMSSQVCWKKHSGGGALIVPKQLAMVPYTLPNMLETKNQTIEGKTIVISGSGNVAQYACEKATQLGGKVVTMSDSSGFIYDKDGIDKDKLAFIMELKNVRRGRIKEYAEKYQCDFFEGQRPWSIACDIALPCATQNELDGTDALELLKNGCHCVSEGANMPSTPEAIEHFLKANILFSPGKASNAEVATRV